MTPNSPRTSRAAVAALLAFVTSQAGAPALAIPLDKANEGNAVGTVVAQQAVDQPLRSDLELVLLGAIRDIAYAAGSDFDYDFHVSQATAAPRPGSQLMDSAFEQATGSPANARKFFFVNW